MNEAVSIISHLAIRLWHGHKRSQELDPSRQVAQSILTRLAAQRKPASVVDLLEHAQVLHPVDVAGAWRRLLRHSAGARSAEVLDVAAHDPIPKLASARIGIKAIHQMHTGIQTHAESA